ncbi:MAG TPA: GlsB/YeaQ/YmgE family stress response membrane protein [Acidimicrobiia bacterium]|nr:GlsB/YeaQ/YmgE family stress response membrane protein [Acidimicrobiia bacterium]
MDWLGTIIASLLAGIIVGPLARLVLPGRQNISLGMTILIGAVGAFLGGLIANWVGVEDTAGLDWTQYLIQVGVAAVLVLAYGAMAGRGSSSAPSSGSTPPPPPAT